MSAFRITIAMAALLCSCVSADVLRLDNTIRPPTDLTAVELLLEEPSREYVAIALINVTDQGWGMRLDDLRKRLVSEAAKLGGDAVILSHQEDASGSIIVPVGQMWMASSVTEKKLIGKVVKYAQQERL
jgi:hypothetical protein